MSIAISTSPGGDIERPSTDGSGLEILELPAALSPPAGASAASVVYGAGNPRPDDPLAWLPCAGILDFSTGDRIYDGSQGNGCLYLVIEGKVKVCRTADNGQQVVVDVFLPDELFGESAFAAGKCATEEAIAVGATRLMTWAAADVEALVLRNPALGMALLRLIANRARDYSARIESFSADTVERRLVRTLLNFGERFGRPADDGFVRMAAFTHETLAQYTGTAREIVTSYMNQLRRAGYLRYSRQETAIDPEALRAWLRRGAAAE